MVITAYGLIEDTVVSIGLTIVAYFILKDIYKSRAKNRWWLKRWTEKDYIRSKWLLENKWVFVILAVTMVILSILFQIFF